MSNFLTTIIWRHRKENLKKCSLRYLENKEDFLFLTYPRDSLSDLSNYILLTLDGPILTENDKNKGLFFIDATWNLAKVMERQLPYMIKRSLPSYKTAYPRRQTGCEDPQRGLATLEAIYIAYKITQRNTDGLLDHYYFKDLFLTINAFS